MFGVDRCEGCQRTIRQNVFPKAAIRAKLPNINVNMILAVIGKFVNVDLRHDLIKVEKL